MAKIASEIMRMHDMFIPFSLPDLGEDEIDEVVKTLRSGWLTTGPVTFQFETEFASYVNSGSALAVNSCTAGLRLALAALDIGPGDEVITTPLTFCATVNVILESGARPVLADIGSDLNICPDAIERAITPHTRGIIPVHLAGLPCHMDAIWAIAETHGLKVIEDAAHAVGSMYQGRMVGGGRSDAVAFSFYATKNLTTGEGGMVTSPDSRLHERMRRLALHGIGRDAWRRYRKDGDWFYEVLECGFKYNMSDIMSSIGVHQLRRLNSMTTRRAAIARRYNGAFAGMSAFALPPDREDSRHSWHLYILRLNLDELAIDRAEFISELHALGIGCSVHFIPIPLHPYYRGVLGSQPACQAAMNVYPRLVSLPLYSKMTDNDVERVIAAVQKVVDRGQSQRRVFVSSVAGMVK